MASSLQNPSYSAPVAPRETFGHRTDMDRAIQGKHAPGVDGTHPSVQGVVGVSLDLKVYDVQISDRAGRGFGIGTHIPPIS